MKQKLKKIIAKYPVGQDNTPAPSGSVPRITNETIAEHREEVLSSARKYIYPLQHSKHKIVVVTTSLIITAVVLLSTYCVAALYKFHGTSSFLYRVTQVIPFPVAKAGPHYVAYENYLFELRHYMFFYQNQQKLDFDSDAGKQQLAEYKKRSLEQVISDAYVKDLARQHKVTVSSREVEDQITILQRQNRLGGSQQAYEDALRQNFGWSPDDFRRVIRQRLLEQKVVTLLDTATKTRVEAAQTELKAGADFAAIVAKYSDDTATKQNGGDFGFTDKSNPDILPQTIDVLFKLKVGEVSGVINTGYGLEIVKKLEDNGDKARGAHMVFNLQDISKYINDLKEKQKARAYITVK